MSRSRTIAGAALIVVLAINPIVAWWASSNNFDLLPALVCVLALFYIQCAFLLRSRMITGAIIGAIFGIAFCAQPAVGSRRDGGAELTGIIIFVVAGATWAAIYDFDRSQSADPLQGIPDASPSKTLGDVQNLQDSH